MKKLINGILMHFGWQITRKGQPRDESRISVSRNSNLKEYFDKTEGMISLEEATLLYQLAKKTTSGCIVEVGSYRGRSSVALGRGSLEGSRVPVYAIEPHQEFTGVLGAKFGPRDRGAFYKAMLDTSCYHIVRLVNLSSEIVAPNWDKKIGLLWIDGDHSHDGVKRDFWSWLPHLTEDAIVAFDDSLEPDLGPRQLITELVEGSRFKEVQRVGKVTLIKREQGC